MSLFGISGFITKNSGNLSCKTSLRLFFSSKGFTSQVCMTFKSSSLSFIKFHPWINTICLILQEKKIKNLNFSLLFPLNKSRAKDLLTLEQDYIYKKTLFSLLNLYLYNVFYENPQFSTEDFFYIVILKTETEIRFLFCPWLFRRFSYTILV